MTKYAVLFSVLLFVHQLSYADFDFNNNCRKAYEDIVQLRLAEASKKLEQEEKVNPENQMIPLLENYVDYFSLLASDSKADFDQLKKNKNSRLSAVSSGSANSPYYYFAQAEINLQWALLRGRYQEYFPAAMEMRKANGLLKKCLQEYPDFLPAKKSLGMLNAILGSLPSGAQKALGTLGVRGDTEYGKKLLLETVNAIPASRYAPFYDESVFYLMQVLVNITKDENAFRQVSDKAGQISSRSLLKTYILSYAALKTGHNDQAIGFIQQRPKGSGYVNYPYLNYLLGLAKLNRLDKDAGQPFQQFLKSSKGASLIKDSYLMLAYSALINDDKAGFQRFRKRVLSEGSTYDERDKQAENEANEEVPKKELLQARFLFDGGYYNRAKDLLLKHDANQYALARDKIEYCYRLGRVYHAMKSYAPALKMYAYAVQMGSDKKYYFAANAALFSGNIYEAQGNKSKATTAYNQAIAMKNHDYESSIENKAKEGLNRLKSK